MSEAPWPLIDITITPASGRDREWLVEALQKLDRDAGHLRISTGQRDGEFVLSGFSEQHLDSGLEMIRREYGIRIFSGQPQAAYRETLGRTVQIDHAHKKSRAGQFAFLKILFEPGEPGSGFEFRSSASAINIPERFVSGVRTGLASASGQGLLAGFPVIDFKATLVDGAYHEVDSSPLAFEIGAKGAFGELRKKGAPKLLEPIMKVEVTTPEDHVGEVIGDLTARCGRIEGSRPEGRVQVINATAPLACLLGYARDLARISRGRAECRIDYDRYAEADARPPTDGPFTETPSLRAATEE